MIETITVLIAKLFILAVFTEGFVEYTFAKKDAYQPWLKYVGLTVGVITCVIYNVDLFAAFGLTTTVPFIGSVFTGLVIGRGSNYLNDFVTRIRSGGGKDEQAS